MGWSNVTDSGGNGYRLFLQERSESCGVACALMALQLTTGKEFSGSSMRSAFGESEGAKNMTSLGIRNFKSSGSEKSVIGDVLHKYGSSGWMELPFNKNKAKKVSKKNPVILGVGWKAVGGKRVGKKWVPGAGHWVCGVNRVSELLVCLDPVFGVVELETENLPWYFTKKGGGIGTIYTIFSK